jgi:zinc/manganese transport system permease protein
MLGQEFMRNALLAGSLIALACGVCGWFVVMRGQVFAGDALSHVAFPGALAAAAAGIDVRVGLFAATIAAGGAIGLLARGRVGVRAGGGGGSAPGPADDAAIGVAFTFILALGVFFLTRFSLGSQGSAGIETARTLFGSIFGLGAGEARLAAIIAAAVLVAVLAISRPLLFASVAPEVAAARGVPTRRLDVALLVLVGVIAAEASQAIGALLLLGLLTAPAAAAQRLVRSPAAGIALAAGLALLAVWCGLVLAYLVPAIPPSTAIVGCAVAMHVLAGVLR